MSKKTKRLLFEGAVPDGTIRILSDRLEGQTFAEGKRTIVVNLARVMSFRDPWYGKVELTRKKFQQMIKNFQSNTYGQEIFIDVAHNPSAGAAATITKLFMDGMKFRAEAEFTEFGVDAVKTRGMKYLSMDFTEEFEDPETEKKHGALLFGAGLTIRPRVKRLDPVVLSLDDDEQPMLLNLRAGKLLAEETQAMWKELLKKLQKQLAEMKLGENVIKQFSENFETTAKTLGDNEEAIKSVMDGFLATAKQLAETEQGTSDTIKLDFSSLNIPAAAGGLDEEGVRKLLAEDARKKAEDAKKLAENRQTNVDLFKKLLDENEGLKGLPEDQRKQLGDAAELITAEMTPEQVTKLAEHQIALGNTMATQTQLAARGFDGPAGSVHISIDERNSAMALQEELLTGLRSTAVHSQGMLSLSEKVSPFIEKVLAEFDRLHAPRLAAEHKMLAAGTTGIVDTDLPVGFQRTVIREALSDLRVLELVQTLTDFTATATTQIPYETRDASAVYNNGVVYEGQPIHRASIKQEMDLAYILPMKLAFLISNEVMHFSRTSAINWDAYARNVEMNARVMRELVVKRICNEIQRNADAYQATSIADEDFGAQLDGATVSTIKTVQYPIVRQHQQTDLKGTNIGSAENPITVKINGVAIVEYDGTGDQAGGTYYRIINYNLGYIQFVTELGVPATPAATAGDEFVSYDYATNMVKFDLDIGAVDIDLHLNGLLRAIGERKALMDTDRYVLPNFQLMSPTLHNTVTNARQFEVQSKKSGTDTDAIGDLDTVKGIPAWKTNAPNVDLGDERIILGQRGTLAYTVSKPFVTGMPFEAVDSNGQPTGQKQAYGEEYSAIKVPTPIRNRMTSVLAYSFTGR